MTTLLSKARERWAELKRIYGGGHREVRNTAVGWQPGGDWIQDPNPPSGTPEFYRVVRDPASAGEKQPEPMTEPQRARRAKQRQVRKVVPE